MRALRLVALFIVASAPLAAQEKARPAIDQALLEKFRALSPEEKARLKERVESLRKLAPGERRRLTENLEKYRALPVERQVALKERLDKMAPEDRKRAAEITQGFFRWMQARYGQVRFPRGAFFRWAAAKRAAEVDALKDLNAGGRIDALLRLAHEYRGVILQQVRQHQRRHKCVTVDELQALEEVTFEAFWESADTLVKRCPNAAKRPAPPARNP